MIPEDTWGQGYCKDQTISLRIYANLPREINIKYTQEKCYSHSKIRNCQGIWFLYVLGFGFFFVLEELSREWENNLDQLFSILICQVTI